MDREKLLRNLKFRLLDCVLFLLRIYHTVLAYIVGIYRYLFFFKVGGIYINKHNHFYDRYEGDGIFREGNKIIDCGYLSVQTVGNLVVFNIFAMGFFKWKKYNP